MGSIYFGSRSETQIYTPPLFSIGNLQTDFSLLTVYCQGVDLQECAARCSILAQAIPRVHVPPTKRQVFSAGWENDIGCNVTGLEKGLRTMPFMNGSKLKEAYKKAKAEKFAFIASNAVDTNGIIGFINGASEAGCDLLIQFSNGACTYAGNGDPIAGLRHLSFTVRQLAGNCPVGVAINIDHGKKSHMGLLRTAVEEGLVSSVMVDASEFPYDENVALSKQVTEFAHQKGILVEAELGTIQGTEDEVHADEAIYTKPEEAVDFVTKTGVDLLAIAVGTAHGVSKGAELELRYDIAEQVDQNLRENGMPIPLVLHGASGVLPHQLARFVEAGITKVNKDTEYQYVYALTQADFYRENQDAIYKPDGVDEHWIPDKKRFDPRVIGKLVQNKIKDQYIELTKQVYAHNTSVFK